MEISLTFDDGPDPNETPRILAALQSVQALATFFVITQQARRYPRLIFEMQHAGHQIQFHCAEHVCHTELTQDQGEKDASVGLQDLETLGIMPQLWRPPWGVTAHWTSEVADRVGLEIALWTANTHDWRGDTTAEMLDTVEPLLGPGAVVLMHDGLGPGVRRTHCGETAALIEPLVARIRNLGCEPFPMKIAD